MRIDSALSRNNLKTVGGIKKSDRVGSRTRSTGKTGLTRAKGLFSIFAKKLS